jgi:hypothetical protein
MSLFAANVLQTRKMLQNLDRWLEEAAGYAESRGFDPEILLTDRLYPDQFPLTRQIQSACDTARFLAARATGQQAPRHEDNETSIAELRARIAATVEYLGGFSEADFVDAEERVITLPFMPGKGAYAAAYLTEFALPNFYFHVTTAYAILRHNGVPLGKRTFLGGMPLFDL